MSRVLKCDPVNPDDALIKEINEVLERGEAVVLPSETQYGLAVRADKDGVTKKICNIKTRDDNQKPALFVKDIEMAEKFCDINENAKKIAAKFLPGPLTMVLPLKESQSQVPNELASEKGIGIRISSHPLLKKLTAVLRFPITATSANISGAVVPDNIDDIKKSFGDSVDLYVDAGTIHGRLASTVIAVNDEIEILRPGLIPEKDIYAAIGGGN